MSLSDVHDLSVDNTVRVGRRIKSCNLIFNFVLKIAKGRTQNSDFMNTEQRCPH